MKKPVINLVTTVHQTQTRTIDMTGALILSLLRAAGLEIPDNARVDFTVPGGGDWSGMSVDVDADHPVQVTWRVETDSVEASEERS